MATQVTEKCTSRPTPWEIVKRVTIGVYNDGFIHAGNLAYLPLLALFPFFITAAAIANCSARAADGQKTVATILAKLPPEVAERAARPDPGSADGAHRAVAVVRRHRRPVDGGELHRDYPRHPAPRLWRPILRAFLDLPAGLDRPDHRRCRAV